MKKIKGFHIFHTNKYKNTKIQKYKKNMLSSRRTLLTKRFRYLASIAASDPLKKCSDCRMYIEDSKTCKINKQLAIENRLHNESVCGKDGNKFWAVDKTKLLLSESSMIYSKLFALTSVTSALAVLAGEEFNASLFIIPTTVCAITSTALFNLSDDLKAEHFRDNDVEPPIACKKCECCKRK